MAAIFFPFPYLAPESSVVTRGSMFDIPIFCKRNIKSHVCKNFYRNIDPSVAKFHLCPYGFGVEVVKFDSESVIFTCLNIERYSNRKEIRRRLCNNDFLPKLMLKDYEFIKQNALNFYKNSQEYIAQIHTEENYANTYKEKMEGLDNTFHELRKLNKQLKSQVESLIYQSDTFSLSRNNIDKIKYLAKNIFHSSQLITIRLNTYDFTINPNLSLREEKSKMPIHKKFVKISHNLREYANNKHIRINLTGKSYGYIQGNDVFELLPYLLLDNAIKYSMPNRNIDVIFKESDTKLIVTIRSYSIRPDNHELINLKMRGMRGRNTESVQGQGIGLYIADIICQTHNIDLTFKLGTEKYYDHTNDNVAYSDFNAILTFNEFIRDNSGDDGNDDY